MVYPKHKLISYCIPLAWRLLICVCSVVQNTTGDNHPQVTNILFSSITNYTEICSITTIKYFLFLYISILNCMPIQYIWLYVPPFSLHLLMSVHPHILHTGTFESGTFGLSEILLNQHFQYPYLLNNINQLFLTIRSSSKCSLLELLCPLARLCRGGGGLKHLDSTSSESTFPNILAHNFHLSLLAGRQDNRTRGKAHRAHERAPLPNLPTPYTSLPPPPTTYPQPS